MINLKPLNQFLHLQTFKMEGLSDLKVLLEPNDFMITIDLSDTYMTLPVLQEDSRNYLCSNFKIKCVFPFGLNDAPRAFTKTLKPPVGTLRSLGFKLVVYLNDIILAAFTRELCIYQGQILIKTLEYLGFVINLEKSNLVPSQVVLFLGFIVDSKKMSFSLPDSKIQSISLSAQTLLNQPCLERNMFLLALYVPGILNKIADLLSRLKRESTEWMLNPRIFKQIVHVYRMQF